MNKVTLLLGLLFIVFFQLSFAQTMKIHTNSGIDEFNLTDIDSITFGVEDSSIVSQPSDGIDATLREANPDDNYGDRDFLVTGTQIAGDSNGLLKFDLTSLPYPIQKVTLKLYNVYGSGHDDTGLTKIYKVMSDWDEQNVTWNNQPIYDSNVQASQSITNTDGWVSIDITSLYKSWKTTSANYGMMIDTEGTTYPPGRFYTSDYIEESLKPFLEIQQ